MSKSLVRSNTDKIFECIDKKKPGLEIGPSIRPLAPKKAGFDVITVDHTSAENLRKKYANVPTGTDHIEHVDIVLDHGKFANQVGPNRVDWVIASHVLEHATDLIGFLLECETVLRPEGILSLVLPDLRGSFDFFRRLTTTGDVLTAWHLGHAVHDSGSVFDHHSRATKVREQIAWNVNSRNLAFKFVHDFNYAKSQYEKSQEKQSDYIDIHRWCFTPSSFKLILLELKCLGIIQLEEVYAFDTVDHEFFVSLRKTGQVSSETNFSDLEAQRLKLLMQASIEVSKAVSQAIYGRAAGERLSLFWTLKAKLTLTFRWLKRILRKKLHKG